MKLRLKVLILLASIWALISLAVFAYTKTTLSQEYLRIENNEVANDVSRTNKTLQSLFSSLKLLTADWGQWNDVYQFMKNKNQAFINANINMPTLENTKLNIILFFDTKGKLFYGTNYDLDNDTFLPLPEDLITNLESLPSYSQLTDAAQETTGIIKLKEGYAVLAAHPIFTSNGKGPSHGTLVMGYFLTERHLAKLSDILLMHVNLHPLPIPANDVRLKQVYDHLTNGNPFFIAAQNDDIIAGYTFINNIAGAPIGILQIEEPRTLYNEGMKTVNRYLGILIGVGILILGVIWLLLKILVLDRIISVSQQLIQISKEGRFDKHILVSGNDELNDMITDVNSFMEIIQLSEKQLKHRISLSSEQLERLSKLNKNLHDEMLHQREVEVELREGEKILRHMAYYDALTSLPNRLFFEELMAKLIARSDRDGTGMAVLFLDADKFKSINDSHGHAIGDKFLKYIAQKLKANIKNSDVVARLSGDEFIICLNNVRGKQILKMIAEKLLEDLATPLETDGLVIRSTFSMGISIYPDDGATIEELSEHADLAMYYAKKQSNTAYCFYDEVTKNIPVIS